MTIADRVRELREAKKWSQAELAATVTKLGGKLSQQNVANIEAGIVKQPKSLLHLARALGVSPMWLDTGIGKREPPPIESRAKSTPDVFISYSGEPQQEMINLLMNKIYDPASMPKGSAQEEAVFALLRYLKLRERR
jgi:transcriptional regulator with XRE-family HTH domain